jgi:hypothetical protein
MEREVCDGEPVRLRLGQRGDGEQAACQSAEIAQSGVAVQGGRIYIERINAPFVFDLKQRLTGWAAAQI